MLAGGWGEDCFGRVGLLCLFDFGLVILIMTVDRNAGFFLYIDLSPWLPHGLEGKEREYALAQRLLDGGVGLHPCEEHNEKPGWFRLVFSLERELLFEGLKR